MTIYIRLGLSILFMFVLLLSILDGCTKKYTQDDIIDADKHFSFPPGFVPDPEKNGKKTIEGIDSDHDGLRDDVQRWIYARYPKDEKKRKALRQLAKVIQGKFNIN
ncbi:MAG: hypothetical protein HY072_02640, partial [Deltaproteobacteria bacterium]|nr:hypothetical protein [Deltaproteobacteria bacterium]